MDEMFSVRGTMDTQNLLIHAPRPQDLPSPLLLQEIHLDTTAWKSLLQAGNFVTARNSQGQVAGVCVANHYSLLYAGDELRQLRAALSVLCNRFKLSPANIAFGLQTVIAPEWQNTDLRARLLRELLRSIGFRYRHLFSFCRKDDPAELRMLELQGWRCFQEEDDGCYLVLDVAKALRGLASQLVLRMPPRPLQPTARATGTR